VARVCKNANIRLYGCGLKYLIMIPTGKEFTTYLDGIFKDKRHRYYDETVEHAVNMGIHVDGDPPTKLLEEKRPNEAEEIRAYRLEVYKPITKAVSRKVISILGRIFNERRFSVIIPDVPNKKIKEDNGLREYLKVGYPQYRTLLNYIKTVFIKQNVGDPNGVIVVAPTFESIEKDDTEFLDPLPVYYEAARILDFIEDDYFVIDITKHTEKNRKYAHRKDKTVDKVMIIDTEFIRIYTRDLNDTRLFWEFRHNFGRPFVFRTGGITAEDMTPYAYESFIAGVLPHWDKAVALSSDLDAMITLYMYPEKWEVETVCSVCSGSRQVDSMVYSGTGSAVEKVKCNHCKGTGRMTRSPFNIHTVSSDALRPEANLPLPPMGYVQKDVEIPRWVDEKLASEIEAGLNAINMDIVNKTGENQSGISKAIDRQELDSFLQTYSDHIFDYVIPNIVRFTVLWRYWLPKLVNDKEAREYVPEINKPTRFDIVSANFLIDEMKTAKEAGLDPSIIKAMQIDIIEKMFTGAEKEKVKTAIIIDSYAGRNSEDLSVLRGNNVITAEEWFIKENLPMLLFVAEENDPKFNDKPILEKRDIVRDLGKAEYAKQKPVLIPVEPIE